MILAITLLSIFTIISITVGCWAAKEELKDTAVSATLGCILFSVSLIVILFKSIGV